MEEEEFKRGLILKEGDLIEHKLFGVCQVYDKKEMSPWYVLFYIQNIETGEEHIINTTFHSHVRMIMDRDDVWISDL